MERIHSYQIQAPLSEGLLAKRYSLPKAHRPPWQYVAL